MKRPALFTGVPFVMGLVLAAALARQLWIPVCGGVTLLAGAVLLWRRDLWKYVLLSTLSCLTACCVYWYTDAGEMAVLSAVLPVESVFSGQITDKTIYANGWTKYILLGKFDAAETAQMKVQVFSDEPAYAFGDTLTIQGIPEEIEGNYVYSSENSRAEYLFLTFGFDAEIVEHLPLQKPTLRSSIRNWRERMTERIHSHMDEDTGAMLTGMLFGEKSGMSYRSRNALYRMGIGHVMAVSGLHLDILALLLTGLLERLGADRRFRFGILTGICLLFVICAGETVSVQRACIMILIGQGAGLFYRQADSMNSLSIAMLILGVSNPFVVHSAAFWLSCSGAFGIGVLAPYMTQNLPQETFWQGLLHDLANGFWVFAAVLPASAVYFREVSLISPVSNLLLVPFCLVAMGLGALAVVLGGNIWAARWFLASAEMMERFVLAVSEKISAFSWTHTGTETEGFLFFLTAGVLLAVFCQILLKSRKLTTIAVLTGLLVTAVLTDVTQLYRENDLKIAVLGTRTDCTLVLTTGQDAVILDMSGGSQVAGYAAAYLAGQSVDTVKGLYLCKPSEAVLQKYTRYMQPEMTCLLRKKAHKTAQTDLHRELLFHGAKIIAEPQFVQIVFGGKTYVCTVERKLPDTAPDVLTICGTCPEQVPECGILMIPDAESVYIPDDYTYIDVHVLELTMTANGLCRVRRL